MDYWEMSGAIEYQIEALDAGRHERGGFVCESPELTEFLHKRARKEMEARISACFVIVPLSEPCRIAGFYTLSAAEIATTDLPVELAKKLPRYPAMPATLLGRLARDESFRGQGLGDRLMQDAFARTAAASFEVGSVAMITDPKDERAARFYKEFGFRPLAGQRLFLTMTEIIQALREGSK
jgi:GNAT superfamily N-acetyltransferase